MTLIEFRALEEAVIAWAVAASFDEVYEANFREAKTRLVEAYHELQDTTGKGADDAQS